MKDEPKSTTKLNIKDWKDKHHTRKKMVSAHDLFDEGMYIGDIWVYKVGKENVPLILDTGNLISIVPHQKGL